jgi:SAM-dependent methyltransferase
MRREPQRDYGLLHRWRFYELVNLAAELVAGLETPLMLDVGLSEYVRLYKMFIPGLRLHTLEQPGCFNTTGFDIDRPHELDLTRRASRDAAQIPRGAFDLVIFAEVIEHLFANPVEVIEWLFSLLKPTGRLLITTPNMYSKIALPAFRNYDNPLAPFPKEEFRTLGQAHLREYSHIELLRFVEQAGGRSKAFFFSACWDEDETLALIERKNMVLVAAPGGGI